VNPPTPSPGQTRHAQSAIRERRHPCKALTELTMIIRWWMRVMGSNATNKWWQSSDQDHSLKTAAQQRKAMGDQTNSAKLLIVPGSEEEVKRLVIQGAGDGLALGNSRHNGLPS
jgi:hypothetical protein